MQAIVLAAGMGKRLDQRIPKPLIEINGIPLLVRLIEQFKRFGIASIIVVTGYQKHLIEDITDTPGVRTVFNPFYPVSDNLVSFWFGQKHISERCILSHGDVVVEDELLRRIIASEGDLVLPLDRSSLDQESMKIQIEEGRITNISKDIPLDQASGESIPLMKFSSTALNQLKRSTEEILEKGQLGQFIDEAVLKLINIGIFDCTILDVTGLRWVEIDTPADLERARNLFGEK